MTHVFQYIRRLKSSRRRLVIVKTFAAGCHGAWSVFRWLCSKTRFRRNGFPCNCRNVRSELKIVIAFFIMSAAAFAIARASFAFARVSFATRAAVSYATYPQIMHTLYIYIYLFLVERTINGYSIRSIA
jgi:hypothetical protein